MSNAELDYLPYGRQQITEKDIAAVISVLKSDFLTQGPLIPKFEKELSNTLNVKFTIAVTNATSALHLACLALDLKDGDIVWTSPNTFVASANCARYCGAEIDFVDININTGLMDMNQLAKKLEISNSLNKLPKAVIPVHFAGSSCDMKTLYKLSKEYKFSIIEDASHAFGGSYDNKAVGSCTYSDFAVFSFHPVKIITSGEGGILCTNNKNLAEKAYLLRSHGIVKDKKLFENEISGPWSYEQQSLGFNYRMNDMQAALGLSQLNRISYIVEERNRQLDFYRDRLRGLPLKMLNIPKGVKSSVHLAVVLLEDFSEYEHKEIFSDLRKRGIGVQLHYGPVHLNPYYRKLGFKENDFLNAELYSKRAISLPLYPGLKEVDQKRVVTELTNSISKFKS
ncbi:UDP-4-amino-4,6-dideoxy-N-acetyl-beta-L-altrosamine transaminase [Prochlorococcus sp. AH-716-D13]|nr:UDP-4-amino-4,6-dideoxy-N-acetyl-beta-L-altrosamine transaminase [Prochlorococcus sp. AH-716-D13]